MPLPNISWRCQPSPESTCGTLINDSCVVTTVWPVPCKEAPAGCFRQSDINQMFGEALCTFGDQIGQVGNCPFTPGTGILGSIDMTCLVSTDCEAPFTPIGVTPTVQAQVQNIYNALCQLKQVNILDTDVTGLNLDCLKGNCDTTITTLGEWIEAISKKVCDCCTPPVQ